MTKTELIADVASRLEVPKKEAERICEQVFDALIEAVAVKDGVSWPGFGMLRRVERVARKGRNPQTGETIDIPAKNAVVFVASKALKERVQ